MGFLSKLFGKKENKPSSTNVSTVPTVYIDLSEEQKKAVYTPTQNRTTVYALLGRGFTSRRL